MTKSQHSHKEKFILILMHFLSLFNVLLILFALAIQVNLLFNQRLIFNQRFNWIIIFTVYGLLPLLWLLCLSIHNWFKMNVMIGTKNIYSKIIFIILAFLIHYATDNLHWFFLRLSIPSYSFFYTIRALYNRPHRISEFFMVLIVIFVFISPLLLKLHIEKHNSTIKAVSPR